MLNKEIPEDQRAESRDFGFNLRQTSLYRTTWFVLVLALLLVVILKHSFDVDALTNLIPFTYNHTLFPLRKLKGRAESKTLSF